MTAAVPLVERLAEVLAGHDADVTSYDAGDIHGCRCGWDLTTEQWRSDDYGWGAYRAHLAAVLLPVVEQAVAEARGEALREAADFIADTAGIGESANNFGRGWYGALDYAVGELRNRADAIATTEGAP